MIADHGRVNRAGPEGFVVVAAGAWPVSLWSPAFARHVDAFC